MKHISQILGPFVRQVKREARFRFGEDTLRTDPAMNEIMMVEGAHPVTFGEVNERFARSFHARPLSEGPIADHTHAISSSVPAKK
jgi:hypothetical protein